MVQALAPNTLYYGDNLAILREHIPNESVDLIYLDPPFNSSASYNVLFKAPEGHQSQAQIEAFDDTWHWSDSAERAFDQVMEGGNSQASEMLRAMLVFLGRNDMMAYLTMMAVRLLELHRVLKPTGSLYLHCDPTASHYLKILLDAVFGKANFLNEIIWRRTGSHNKAKRFGPIHDVILFYQKSEKYIHTQVYKPYLLGHVKSYFKKKDKGGEYWGNALTGAGTRKGESGQAWRGYNPTEHNRHWAIPSIVVDDLGIDPSLKTLAKLEALVAAGYVEFPEAASLAMPTYKQYLLKSKGMPLQDIWAYQPHSRGLLQGAYVGLDEDVRWLTSQGDKERLGYPTQKPIGLLERILAASSKVGDVILDPFCGCGTTIHAAEKMKRNWIGIDITHLAIGLIRQRLMDAFPYIKFKTVGVPKDTDGARALALADKYEFQKWALSMIDAQPFKGGKKGGDGGVDGYLYFKPDGKKTEKAIVSVKGGQSMNPAMVKDLIVTVDQEGAKMGVFLTLEPPTKGMISQAAAAGIYKTEFGQFPKIQIVTVEQLFQPASAIQMPWQDTSVFRKSQREPAPQPKLEL